MGNVEATGGCMVRESSFGSKSENYPDSEEVERFVLKYTCTPLSQITRTLEWQNSKFKYMSIYDRVLVGVIDSLENNFNRWKYDDFLKFYEVYNPLFMSVKCQFSEYYYSREESRDIFIKLLKYQYHDYATAHGFTLDEMIHNVLEEIFKICEKKYTDKNTFEIIGPEYSGKSFFTEAISAFYLNVGAITRFFHSGIPLLENGSEKRINVWDDDDYVCSAGALKKVLGGDPHPEYLSARSRLDFRTPILLTARNQNIPFSPTFNNLMIRYTWKTAPFLKYYDKKLNPLCIPLVYSAYDIDLE